VRAPIVQNQESWRAAKAQLAAWIDAAVAKDDRAAAAHQWLVANEAKIEAAFAQFKSARLVARMKELISSTAGAADASASGSAQSDATVGSLASIIGALSDEQKSALKKIFA
jgi:SH3-like domain-containing protein